MDYTQNYPYTFATVRICGWQTPPDTCGYPQLLDPRWGGMLTVSAENSVAQAENAEAPSRELCSGRSSAISAAMTAAHEPIADNPSRPSIQPTAAGGPGGSLGICGAAPPTDPAENALHGQEGTIETTDTAATSERPGDNALAGGPGSVAPITTRIDQAFLKLRSALTDLQ